MRVGMILLVPALAGCFGDRERPGPSETAAEAELSVRLLAPASGATVQTGQDITVQVEARDLNLQSLAGVGFVARRLGPGLPVVDSGAVHFATRSDSVHAFTFQVPNTTPTNTQVDVYGIAFGAAGSALLSAPSHLTVVQCPTGVCQ